MEHVERCLFDLRRGLPIRLRDDTVDVLIWPVEHLDENALGRLRHVADDNPALVVTGHRLASVKSIASQANETSNARIGITAADAADDVIRWACTPDVEIDAGRIGPGPDDNIDTLALFLMRCALLIPAAVVATIGVDARGELDTDVDTRDLLSIEPATVHAYEAGRPEPLKRVSESEVPLADASSTRFVVFREPDGMREHIAILIGDSQHWPTPVPVRLHSACLTGDLFGSLRCDCGEQLRGSVAAIGERGGGVLLYLAQEGRGIGLANKMRAYHLQDDGLDTIDADQVLGFSEDERRYTIASEMLAALDIHTIDLLTNNPAKLDAMRQNGIAVAARQAIYGYLTPQNRGYLNAKATRAGHWLDNLLDHSAER
ncbi:GTP cyclohydrolase II RibA [Salinisphaera sp. USBA-960]|nr:GTP cyclohydrolase II RibA [Salifodinibacter halophilus]NNC26152.1 GTP cyclohydrolase II RibA [Salifodinibacter halophilus]